LNCTAIDRGIEEVAAEVFGGEFFGRTKDVGLKSVISACIEEPLS
jgi:hypothetical protein